MSIRQESPSLDERRRRHRGTSGRVPQREILVTKCASTIHRLIESLEDVAGATHRMTFVDEAGNEAGITYRRFAEEVFHQAGSYNFV